MDKKVLKTIIKLMIVIFCVSLIFSSIVSQDEHHLETCHDEHCTVCSMIQMAQSIISLSVAIVMCTFVGFLIYFLLSRIYKEEKVFVLESLVFQKVQLNE